MNIIRVLYTVLLFKKKIRMRWRDKMFRVAVVDDNPVFLEKSKKITGKFFEERKLECEIKTYERANSVIEVF